MVSNATKHGGGIRKSGVVSSSGCSGKWCNGVIKNWIDQSINFGDANARALFAHWTIIIFWLLRLFPSFIIGVCVIIVLVSVISLVFLCFTLLFSTLIYSLFLMHTVIPYPSGGGFQNMESRMIVSFSDDPFLDKPYWDAMFTHKPTLLLSYPYRWSRHVTFLLYILLELGYHHWMLDFET